MKFTCVRDNLLRGLGIVSHVAGKNVTLPILSNILLDAKGGELRLSATNLEVGVMTSVRGRVEKEGTVTVPAKLLFDYVNLINPDQATLELDDQSLSIQGEQHHTKIRIMSAEEFPLIPVPEKKESVTIESGVLKAGLADVVFAASMDEMRPELSGTFFSFNGDELVIVATDSYRLAEKKLNLKSGIGAEKQVVVPLKTLYELMRILQEVGDGEEVEMAFEDNQVVFSFDETNIVSRLVEGQFPDYKQIISPETQTKVEFVREEMIKVVKVSGLFTKTGINDVLLEFVPADGKVTVKTTNTQLGENTSQVDAEISGEKDSIVFNWKYLLDGLNTIKTDKVVLETNTSASPGILKPVGEDGYLYLIMPIKQ